MGIIVDLKSGSFDSIRPDRSCCSFWLAQWGKISAKREGHREPDAALLKPRSNLERHCASVLEQVIHINA